MASCGERRATLRRRQSSADEVETHWISGITANMGRCVNNYQALPNSMHTCDECETEEAVMKKSIQILGQDPIARYYLCLVCFLNLELNNC